MTTAMNYNRDCHHLEGHSTPCGSRLIHTHDLGGRMRRFGITLVDTLFETGADGQRTGASIPAGFGYAWVSSCEYEAWRVYDAFTSGQRTWP